MLKLARWSTTHRSSVFPGWIALAIVVKVGVPIAGVRPAVAGDGAED